MSIFETRDKVVFNPDFDFNETLRKRLKCDNDNDESELENFKIELIADGMTDLGFDFFCKSENKQTVFWFNITPEKTIELYHALKKEIEHLKTLNDLKFILDGDL